MVSTVNLSQMAQLQRFQYLKLKFIDLLDNTDLSAYNENWSSKANVLRNCGTFIELQDGRVIRSNFCRSRFCPLCQSRRSLKMYAEILKKLNSIEDEYSALHVTLTVPNVDEEHLKTTISSLFSGSSKLFKSFPQFKGVGRFLEVTYSELHDNFHPHLHCIVLVKPSYFKSRYYVSREKLSASWGNIMHLENPQVHISSRGEDKGLVAEVAKYCVKPFDFYAYDLNFHRVLQIYENLKSRRLVQFYGILKGVNVEDVDDGMVDDTEKVAFSWDEKSRKYILL